MVAMAEALERAGMLGEYFTGLAFSRAILSKYLAHTPSNAARRAIMRNLGRRQLPDAIQAWTTPRIVGLLDVLAVLAQRISCARVARMPLIRLRNRRFDRSVSHHLAGNSRAFVGAYTASLHCFRRAKRLGIMTYLDYPVAHHRFAEALLTEEAELTPEYAETLQFHGLPDWLKRRMEQEIELADRVFVLSTFQHRTFVEMGVEETKLIQTPLGVDLNLFRPTHEGEQGDRPFRVIFVGQITQRKGISYLVDAFQKAGLPNSELVLVGQPCGSGGAWRRLPAVRHIPHVPRWELPDLYGKSDVFVLPSLIEGFPQTALEAMACGLPVIVSENTFGEDVICDGRDGFVIPIRQVDAIVDRLRFLHQNPAKGHEIGLNARRRAEDFSWEHYGQRIISAIAVPGGSPPQPPIPLLAKALSEVEC
jgi:glycosyltransferase involved in cell wall biosynthesis